MAVFSPLTSRRSTRRKGVATQQVIVFRLRNECFALPIRAVQKVIPMGNVYGAPQGGGVSLTLYQDQEILVIDPGHRIFRGTPSQDSSSAVGGVRSVCASFTTDSESVRLCSDEPQTPQTTAPLPMNDTTGARYLLLVQGSSGKLVGLPIEEPPALLRVPESAFSPLLSDYISEGNIRCVSALIIQNNDEPPLFLLNPDQLVQPQQALPPAFR